MARIAVVDAHRSVVVVLAVLLHPSRGHRLDGRRHETLLALQQFDLQRFAPVGAIDFFERDFQRGCSFNQTARKISRVLSVVSLVTEVSLSANRASVESSLEPVSTSTAKILNLSRSRLSLRRASHSGLTCDSPSVIITISARLSCLRSINSIAALSGRSKSVPPPGKYSASSSSPARSG